MKTKILLILIATFSFVGLSATEFIVDGITYTTTSDRTVSVGNNRYYDLSKNITIPASVNNEGTTYSVTAIGNNAFMWNSNLTSITIPNSVTTIGSSAFSSCRNMTSVTLPNSVTSIGDFAFNNDTALTSITFPSSITSIGTWAFAGCTKLTTITLPSSITYIGMAAFQNCISLTSITLPNGITSISNQTLKGCTALTSIALPNSVTTIGDWAFNSCTNLTSIALSSNLSTIGVSAFEACESLTSISLPNGVTSIKTATFKECTALTSITLPSSLTTIEDWAFDSCTNLSYISAEMTKPPTINTNHFEDVNISNCTLEVPASSFSTYKSAYMWNRFGGIVGKFSLGDTFTVDSIKYKVTDLATKTVEVIQNSYTQVNMVIPETATYAGNTFSVTGIGSAAFYECSALKSISIPKSLVSIGNYAFYRCISLTSISIPDGVTSIGMNAFLNCSALASIDIPNSVTTLEYQAFYGCTALTSISIPPAVTAISERTFYGCTALTNINIPNSVTSIGTYAFYYCNALTNINIPASVTSIGTYAFHNCTSLSKISVEIATPLTIDANVFAGVNLSACTLEVPAGSFADYQNTAVWTDFGSVVEKLSLGDTFTVDSIKYKVTDLATKTVEVIQNSYKQVNMVIPETVTYAGNTFSVTAIGDWAFAYCNSLSSITIPNSVTAIGDYAFSYCSSITSITIPNSVTAIGGYAFSDCSSITSITVPNSVTAIGEGTFSYCSNLTSITIPNSVTSIGENSFYYCTALNSITIPSSVTSIGKDAFADCSLVNQFIVDDNNQYFSTIDGVLFDKQKTILIAYPIGKNTSSYIVPDGVSTIGYNAFCDCIDLISISLPSSVATIDDYAFYGCSKLNKVSVDIATPIAIDSTVFARVSLSACTLEVPAGSFAAYNDAPVWRGFGSIVQKITTSVNNLSVGSNKLYYANGGLQSLENVALSSLIIYNLNGKTVYRQDNFSGNSIPLQLPQGIYLLKAISTDKQTYTKKIMIK